MRQVKRLRNLAITLRQEAESLREDARAARNRSLAAIKREAAKELELDAESSMQGAACIESALIRKGVIEQKDTGSKPRPRKPSPVALAALNGKAVRTPAGRKKSRTSRAK